MIMAWNEKISAVVSVDARGFIEYWRVDDVSAGPDGRHSDRDSRPIPGVRFETKIRTDLFEFAKKKVVPTSLSINGAGTLFVCTTPDRFVRVFRFTTGKLERCYDARLPAITGSSAA